MTAEQPDQDTTRDYTAEEKEALAAQAKREAELAKQQRERE